MIPTMEGVTDNPCFDRSMAELCVKHGILDSIKEWENADDGIRMEWLDDLYQKGVFDSILKED